MFYGRPVYWLLAVNVRATRDLFPGRARADRQLARPARRALQSVIRVSGSAITSVKLNNSLSLKTHTGH
jgi:hypothetical protein